MGGTECIAYIIVCEIRELFAELLAVLCLLSATETCILKKDYVPFFHSIHCLCCSFTGYIVIRNEYNFLSKLCGKALCNRCKGFSLVRSVFNFSEVGAENYLAAIVDQLLDRRESRVDTCLICDLAVLKRYIEIAAD